MRILILTSCTGEKACSPENQLTLSDFQAGKNQVKAREKELAQWMTPAQELYTGQQHVRLMRGIELLRAQNGSFHLDFQILSAGYGLISGERSIAPYEATFQGMGKAELRDWAMQLEVAGDFTRLMGGKRDLNVILLGDSYLEACGITAQTDFASPTLLFCGTGAAKKLPVHSNLKVVTLSNSEAKRFSCGLVALKGELAHRICVDLVIGKLTSEKLVGLESDVLDLLDQGKTIAAESAKKPATQPKAEVDWVIQIPKSWWNKPHRQKLRYFIPEWDDLVDADYDFLSDAHSGENCGWDNAVYAHQMYPEPNYDGLLMSRAVAEKSKAKKERINRLGVHRMLRVPREFPIMGDCGAFDYIMEDVPPYTTEDVLDYYTRLDFDYGVSVDHLIVTATEHQKQARYELTIQNAAEFLKEHRKAGLKWEPIGAVQGWDPKSYADAVGQYVKMGYRYIGLGGLVRTQTAEIVQILKQVRHNVPAGIGVHLFGLARLNAIKDMADLGVTSVDSASPLRRAWLGGKDNYWSMDGAHYRAIRIPEAGKSFRAKRMVSEGRAGADFVEEVESRLMRLLRSFDQGNETVDNVLAALAEYDHLITPDRASELDEYRRTLDAKPWKDCCCDICKKDGIEVVIFRGNNRNRRRGFHNVFVFYRMMQGILNGTMKAPARVRGLHAYQTELELGV